MQTNSQLFYLPVLQSSVLVLMSVLGMPELACILCLLLNLACLLRLVGTILPPRRNDELDVGAGTPVPLWIRVMMRNMLFASLSAALGFFAVFLPSGLPADLVMVTTTLVSCLVCFMAVRSALLLNDQDKAPATDDARAEEAEEAKDADENVRDVSLTRVNKGKNLDRIFRRMENYFENEKPYLNKRLSMTRVAETIGSNRTYLSYALARNHDGNFNHYVNSWRIRYAMDLFSKNHSLKVEDLAQTCGFSSASRFSLSFQEIVGMCPSEWMRRCREEDDD